MIRAPAFPSCLLVLLGSLLLSAKPNFAQDFPQTPTPQARLTLPEIVERLTAGNDERAAALSGYRSRRTYQIDYQGIPGNLHAEMVVELEYSAPSSEEFQVVSQSGSKFLIDLVLKRLMDVERESHEDKYRDSVQITGRNYNFTLLESQQAPDGCSYVLRAEPKVPTKFLFRGRVWVDDKDFAVCRIEAEPARNSSFWIKKAEIHHSYKKVGEFWLPADDTSICHIRMNGRATVTIHYGDYEIQTTHALKVTPPQP